MSLNDSEEGPGPEIILNDVSPDAVQEFSVATSTFSAEYGATGGGIMRYTIRSGTNQFHGNVYEYFKNAVLDARGFYVHNRSADYQNEFGGSIGGPIRKNRSFFFFNWNGYRFDQGAANTLDSVPPAAMRNGDLSGYVGANGNMIPIYDPTTTQPNGAGGYTRQPFPGNIIPTSELSSVSKAVLTYEPMPNVSGAGIVNNYIESGSARTTNNKYTIKLNHDFNANHRLSGTWSSGNTYSGALKNLPDPLNSNLDSTDIEQNLRVGYDWILKPNMLVHMGFGLNRAHRIDVDSTTWGKNWGQKIGLTGVPNGDFPGCQFWGIRKFSFWEYVYGICHKQVRQRLCSINLPLYCGPHLGERQKQTGSLEWIPVD